MAQQKKIQVKVLFVEDQLRLLRLAAANQNITAATFLKQYGVVAATKEMREFSPPPLSSDIPAAVKTGKN